MESDARNMVAVPAGSQSWVLGRKRGGRGRRRGRRLALWRAVLTKGLGRLGDPETVPRTDRRWGEQPP
ncbi:hypothetical protein V2J94_41970 [Streptomyces sp. DSM 41524]|uniref:Transposase n=1 Tax=Streptomyces asiaticus subsp. ignotus TaxID=3098222 RepID=A0ABU7QAA6_9ACTN|nr:hypothetical protein [Streptomyces sp. DSM 41524]